MALTAGRNTKKYGVGKVVADQVSIAQAGSKKIYEGALVGLNASGYGVQADDASCVLVVGVAEMDPNVGNVSDSTGLADGALTIRALQGIFKLANSASADLISIANRGAPCYVVDAGTVAKTTGTGGARIFAGLVFNVDSAGLVEVSVAFQLGLAALVAAGGIVGSGNPEEISANGPLSVVKRTSRLTISGTKAYTLADGTVAGQRKTIYGVSAASTPSGVVTPAHASGFTTITFGAGTAGASVELEWDNSLGTPAWKVVGQNANGGTLTIA